MKNIEQLENRIYSYRELCEVLGESIKSSDSKIAQLKEWARFFRWSNPTTHKYLIEEVYAVPKEKEDGRRKNGGNCTSKYVALDDVIMDFMFEEKQFQGTVASFACILNLLTQTYLNNRYQHWEFDERDIDKLLVNNIFLKIDGIVINALKSALARLKADEYVNYDIHIVLAYSDGKKRKLTLEETKIIQDFEAEIRMEMGIELKDLFRGDVKENFYRKVKYKINEKFNIFLDYYYQEYDIRVCEKEYMNKTTKRHDEVIRLLVKEVCCAMIRIPFDNYKMSNDENCICTIGILNELFWGMGDEVWYKFFNEGEVEDNINSKDMAFFVKYCLHYYNYQVRLKKKLIKQSEKSETAETIDYRKLAMERLDKEEFEFAETAIPNLDWSKVYIESEEQEAYIKFCEKLMFKYLETVDKLSYLQDEEQKKKITELVMKDAIEAYQREDDMYWLELL